LVDLQDVESEFKKKLDIVQKAQKVLAEDLYIGQFAGAVDRRSL